MSRPNCLHYLTFAMVLPAACASAPEQTNNTRVLQIDNRSGCALFLRQAVRDGWGATTSLGDASSIAARLAPGRYALRIGTNGPHIPLPVPIAELGFEPPTKTSVTVWPWPKPLPGWCWIPSGYALRGDDLGIGQEDERPMSTPMSNGFWLAERETTNAQFVTFLNAIGRDAIDHTWLDLGGRKCRVAWRDSANAFTTDVPDLPIVTVSFGGALAYCSWLSQTNGARHRLPSETEWEKAARGPGSRVYAYGDTFRTAAANQESGRLVATGCYSPNGFGLFDMTGNAFEWTGDCYHRDAYGGTQTTCDEHCAYRSLRGGSFVLDGIFVRNSMRMRLRPEVRADDVGFRVLREHVAE